MEDPDPDKSVAVKIEGISLTTTIIRISNGENVQNSTLHNMNEITIKYESDIEIDNQENYYGERKRVEDTSISINQYEKIIKNERDFIKLEPEEEFIINDLENAFDIEPPTSIDYSKSELISKKKLGHKLNNEKFGPIHDKPIIENPNEVKKKVKMHVKKPFNFKCLLCSKCFTGFSNLSNHTRKHTREKPYFCKKCPKSFAELYTLRRHKYLHKNKNKMPFSCSVCFKMFAHKGHLNRHILSHTNNNEKPFSCSICKMSFAQKSNLKRHEESPNAHPILNHKLDATSKLEKCSICSVMLKNLRGLGQHMQVHKEILNLPHKCTLCTNSFSSKKSLQHHLRIKHTDNQLYTCTVCSKNFANKSSLNRHSTAIHNKEKGKKGHLKCPKCPKTFFRADNLKCHSLIHSNKKEFLCPFCKEKFRHRQNLNSHISFEHS